jgi:hypothetical protein
MADIPPLLPPMFVDQAERIFLNFVSAHSDSMPLAIDQNRIIRYCDPRLREMLGYGWQSEVVNGSTLVDILLPQELRAWHAKIIAQWWTDPRALSMHERGPLPLMTKRGAVYSALVKLIMYEPQEPGRRPLLDDPIYRKYAVAFITLLPAAWSRYMHPADFGGAHPDAGPGDAQRPTGP